MSDLETALQRLFSRQRLGIKLGLDLEERLLAELGHPECGYGIVHVAGTNGKGSVCAMLESVFRALGYRTGLYSSPHLVRFNERFQVAGRTVGDAELLELVAATEAAAQRVEERLGREATFFECGTAIAFDHFKRSGVQIAVLETGLGGRLDATNVCTPLVSVITGIGLEHTEFLGPDLESIAAEKGGIIKPGRPVVCGAMPDEARAVIERIASERKAPFLGVPEHVTVRVVDSSLDGVKVSIESSSTAYGTVRVPLGGLYQAQNVATAIAALETTQSVLGLPCDPARVLQGLGETCWPGRCQVLDRDPVVVLDGAHNPDAAQALSKWLKKVRGKHEVGLVIGMCGDKDTEGVVRHLAGLAGRMWVVPIKNARSVDPAVLLAHARRFNVPAEEADLPTALRDARQWAATGQRMVCITGSLFLVGEVLERVEAGQGRAKSMP